MGTLPPVCGEADGFPDFPDGLPTALHLPSNFSLSVASATAGNLSHLSLGAFQLGVFPFGPSGTTIPLSILASDPLQATEVSSVFHIINVPEPGTGTLILLGAAALVMRLRR